MVEEENSKETIEWARLEFDREKFDSELEVRKQELELNRKEQDRSPYRSPLFLGILVAVITLVGNFAATIYNGVVEREKIVAQSALEDRRAQASLVLEAVKTGDPDAAADNLQFLLDAQLITDENGTLASYLKSRDPGTGIFLPSSEGTRTFTDPPETTDPRIEIFASSARCLASRQRQPRLPRSSESDLRIVTWNLEFLGRSESGPGKNKDLSWLGCTLAWLNPDVLAIQEVNGESEPAATLESLAQELKRQTGENWAYVLQSCSGRQMLGFLIRRDHYEIQANQTIWYLNSKAQSEADACDRLRPGLAVQVKAKESPSAKDYAHQVVTLVNIHADAGNQDSDYESREILRANFSRLAEDESVVASDGRLVVLGDFNTIGRVDGISSESEVELTADAFAGISTRPLSLMTSSETCTYIWQNECIAIDHIAVDQNFPSLNNTNAQSFGYCTITKQFGLEATSLASRENLSDHCPVVLDLDM